MLRITIILILLSLLLCSVFAGQKKMEDLIIQSKEEYIMHKEKTENVIYLAGGCFWGLEQLMQSIPGVIDAESGYANGFCERL